MTEKLTRTPNTREKSFRGSSGQNHLGMDFAEHLKSLVSSQQEPSNTRVDLGQWEKFASDLNIELLLLSFIFHL
jgi:hypothetical protein